jgi:hypothetical protein
LVLATINIHRPLTESLDRSTPGFSIAAIHVARALARPARSVLCPYVEAGSALRLNQPPITVDDTLERR